MRRARPTAGLCAACDHRRWITSDRGSDFLLCLLSRQDLRFPRYPRLPVLRCDGFEVREGDGAPS